MMQLELELINNRMTLDERIGYGASKMWCVSPELFGDVGADIYDFLSDNYVYFLDHAQSPQDLVDGLSQLSPLADDALTLAEKIGQREFELFKQALLTQRLEALGLYPDPRNHIEMPERFYPLLVPNQIIQAQMVAEEFEVPLGAAWIRVLQYENQ